MKMYLSALTACFVALVLSACGGSNSDNGPPPNTKTTANVSNKTASNFSSVSIEEHLTGKVFHSGAFDCAAKQTDCKLYYTGSEITGPAVAFFKDAQGRIVGIYDVESAPGSYMAPEVTNWTTGAYLYEALANLDPGFKNMPEVERQAALNVFVAEKNALESANPTDSTNPLASLTDHYEELALNYLNQQRSGPVSIDAYINALGKRLANREVAPVAEFAVPAYVTTASIGSLRFALVSRFKMLQESDWISTAHAQSASTSCTQGMGVFMALFQGATQGIPAAFPIAGVVGKAAGGVGFAVCNTTVVRLDDIINKLVIVQNSLDNLTDDVGKLTNFVASVQTNTNLQDFTNVSTDLSTLAGQYQVILGNNNVASLKEYVQKVGGPGSDGLSNVVSKEPDGIFAKMLGRLPATSDQSYLLQIQRLTENQFDSLLIALDLLCKNPSTGDIIKQRVQCNLVIATSTSRLVAAQAIAYQIASDTYDLLEAYPTEATRYGYDLRKTAAQNKVALKAKFDQQAELMVTKYNSTIQNLNGSTGIYNTFDGIPTALLDSIKAANCAGNQGDPYGRVQSISGWIKQGRNEYLITNCKNFATPILARYYLMIDSNAVNGNDVANVMGVLIQSSSLVGQDGGFSWRGSFVDAPVGTNNLKLNLVLQPGPVPYTFAVNGVENGSPKFIYDQLPTNSPVDLYAQIFKATDSELDNSLPKWIDQLITKWGPSSTHTGVRLGGHAYIRYTDKVGYSVVYGLLPAYQLGRSAMSMHCLTGDCSTKYTGAWYEKFGYLVFKDGPFNISLKDSWFYIDGVNPYK